MLPDLPRDGETLLSRIIAGLIGDEEVEEAQRRLAPMYRRPEWPNATLDEYADWEERAQSLSRAMSKCLQEVYRHVETDPPGALRRALALQTVSTLLPSRNPEVVTLAVGYALLKNERFFDAIDPLREAAASCHGNGEPADVIAVLRLLIDALRHAKESKDALRTCDEALTLAAGGGLRGSHAALLLERGEILAEAGREAEALSSLSRAVDEVRRLTPEEIRGQSPPSLGACLLSLGTVLRRFGRFEQAIGTFREAAETEKRVGYPVGYAWGLSEIGYTYGAAGEPERAIEYLEAAARAGREAGDTVNSARWQRQVNAARGRRSDVAVIPADDSIEARTAAEAYDYSTLAEQAAVEGRYDDAERAARIALRWAELRNDFDLEIATLTILGKIHSDREELDQACELMRRAISLAYRTSNRAVELRLRANLPNGFLRKGDYSSAADVLIEAIATAKVLLARTEGSEIRQSIMAEAIRIYEMYALLLSHAHDHERLLSITEQARARNLTGWIEAETRLGRLTESAAGASAVTALREMRAAEIELEVRHQTKELDTLEVERVLARRNAAHERIEEALRATGTPLLPWQVPNTDLGAVGDAVEALVDQQTALLCLFSVSEGICPVLATRDGGQVKYSGTFIPSDRRERRAAVATWTQALDVDAGCDAVDAFLASFRAKTFDPIERLLQGKKIERLAVIPHADLSLLPYWELLDRCPGLQSLTIAPSVGVLRLCETRRRNARGATLLLMEPTRSLPGAESEAEIVRKARSDAAVITPAAVNDIEQAAPRCTLFHAATHGLFLPDRPYHSGIVATAERDAAADRFTQFVDGDLQPVRAAVDGGARLLTVAEIMARLSLRECRLAVVSACRSGLPRVHAGGEMTGLPSSLLVAGAQSVVASLWPVEDAATALLMESFYDEWDGGHGREASPARALCLARARLRAMTRAEAIARLGSAEDIPHGARPFDHPFYLDAFTCFGGW